MPLQSSNHSALPTGHPNATMTKDTAAPFIMPYNNNNTLIVAQPAVSPHDTAADTDSPTDNTHLRHLKRLMCFPYPPAIEWKPTQPTLRPIVTEREHEVGKLTNSRARETLNQVVKTMQATIRASGETSARTLVASRQKGQRRHCFLLPYMSRPYAVFEAVGAMIYAMEWTGHDSDSLHRTDAERLQLLGLGRTTTEPVPAGYVLKPPVTSLKSFVPELRCMFEMMLAVDYGFPPRTIWDERPTIASWSEFQTITDFLVEIARIWRWRQGLPDDRSWALIAHLTGDWVDDTGLKLPVWDVATMIYYYQIHRKLLSGQILDEACAARTGYTGVLQEMIEEVPTRGKDRLERKLSLDVHLLIPKFVRDRKVQEEMLLMAQNLAAQNGCQLAPPEMPEPREMPKVAEMPKPPIWCRLLDIVSPRKGPEWTEKADEKLKELEWDSD